MKIVAICLLFVAPLIAEEKPAQVLNPYKMRVGDIGKFPPGTFIVRAQRGQWLLLEFTGKDEKRKASFLFESSGAKQADDSEFDMPPFLFRVERTEEFRGKTYNLVWDNFRK